MAPILTMFQPLCRVDQGSGLMLLFAPIGSIWYEKGGFSMTPQNTISPARSGSKISAFIVCMNEEKNIRRCLDSLKWCDEIIVVDSGSSDKTLDICREYKTKIFQRPWPGFVEQKRFALAQCTNEWILNLDSDEEVSGALQEEILAILSRASGQQSPNGSFT